MSSANLAAWHTAMLLRFSLKPAKKMAMLTTLANDR